MSATETRHIGAALKRKEDDPLLRGRGSYVDNINLPGTVVMAVVRSPYAHARITSIDTAAAKDADGVVAVYTGADLRDDWKAAMPCAWPVTEDMKSPEHFPLAVGEVHYEGDGVAVVIADTRAQAIDAAELVDVDYEPLEVLVDVEAAAQDGAALVHEELGTNVSYVWKLETGTFDDGADVIVKHRYVQPPLIPNAMEPRGVVARPEPGGDVTLWSATQIPHILRLLTAATLGMSETKLRVIAPDVGGGFGSKLDVYAEELLAVAVARRLGSPVKWVEERSENALATIHGRDFVTTLELAATEDGKITSIRANVIASMGAYLQLVTPGIPLLGAWIYAGPYAIPNYSVTFTGVFTNTTPTDAYRGAGRPEATYAIERAVDALARKLDKDPVVLRRLNFIREFPATMASGLTVDSGDYDAHLDAALELLDYDDLRRQQTERRARGDTRELGIGFSRLRASSAPSVTARAVGMRPPSASYRLGRCRC
jgi:carbon-monoxide dehydrogenase large subunit